MISQSRTKNGAVDPNIDARAAELTACLENMRNNPKGALRALQALPPDRVSTYGLVQSGRAKLMLEDLKGAASDFEEVIGELDPRAGDAVEARYYMAKLEFARKRWKQAHGHLEAMFAVSPFEHRAYRLRAWMQMLEGDLEGQDQTLASMRFAEEVARCHRLLQHEDFREAIACARELLARFPGRLEPRYYLACALAQCGEDEAALAEIRQVLIQEPGLRAQSLDEFYFEPLRLRDRVEFRDKPGAAA
jgi:tetratricopeptide (TPR) repeat protein